MTFRALCNNHASAGLKVYVTGDAPDVYEESLLQVARAGGTAEESFHPTLLLVGTRLGIERITPAYRDALKAALQMPQSVGIAGYVFFTSNILLYSTNCTIPRFTPLTH